MGIFPINRGENKKCLSCHHRVRRVLCCFFVCLFFCFPGFKLKTWLGLGLEFFLVKMVN